MGGQPYNIREKGLGQGLLHMLYNKFRKKLGAMAPLPPPPSGFYGHVMCLQYNRMLHTSVTLGLCGATHWYLVLGRGVDCLDKPHLLLSGGGDNCMINTTPTPHLTSYPYLHTYNAILCFSYIIESVTDAFRVNLLIEFLFEHFFWMRSPSSLRTTQLCSWLHHVIFLLNIYSL